MKYIKKYKLFENVITFLNLSNQNLIELPDLPDTLEILWCYSNKLIELPKLPSHSSILSINILFPNLIFEA